MQKETEINYTFKMLYVLAIFMIVDGHIGTFDYLSLHGLLRYQNYHIALFMFTSGYFLNLSRSGAEFFKRKFVRLILPLYIWNLFYGLVCWYLNHYQGFKIGAELDMYNLLLAPITDGHQYIYNMGSWFLIPLFLIQTVSFIILRPTASLNRRGQALAAFLYFAFCLLLGAVALIKGPQNAGNANLTLAVLRMLYFLPTFSFGILYRHILEKYDRLKTPLYLCILLFIVALLCYYYPHYNHIPSWLSYVGAPFWVIYAISFCAILFWVRVAKVCAPLIEKSKTLQYVSNHTFDIMIHHFIGFMFIKAILQNCANFDVTSYKTDIWYNFYPINEELIVWLYIIITIVIALIVGFTSRQIYAKIALHIKFGSNMTGSKK